MASSVENSPVLVSRHVTALARTAPATVVVWTWVAKALGMRLTVLPWGAHEPAMPAVSAMGT